MECEYANVQHDCTGAAQWRIWADVTMEWHYACPAAVDALTGGRYARRSLGESHMPRRINFVMEEIA
jgi:hypothetical protein